jgi:hypothetical protein
MVRAKRMQRTAGIHATSSLEAHAVAMANITGEAAPVNVLGLAAKNHALGEFFLILFILS